MSASFALSALSAALSIVCCALVLRRWWGKRRPHLLAWGLGLLLYAMGTSCQVILARVWSPAAFALWYWSGAIMVAPVLGQGAVYLLWRRGSIARNLNMALLLVAVMTLPWTLFFTEFNSTAWQAGRDMTAIFKDHYKEGAIVEGIMRGGMSGTVRFFSPVMNTWGHAHAGGRRALFRTPIPPQTHPAATGNGQRAHRHRRPAPGLRRPDAAPGRPHL